MFSFDLLTQPWIPVLDTDGKIRDVGLRELLLDAHNFREIAHDSPLFVVSLLSIAVALLHRVLPGDTTIEREDEWERIWNQGHFDAEALDAYFEKWANRFDLLHPKFPFYQVANMTMDEATPLSRLALEENNAGMFANPLSAQWQAPSPALAAQLLICIQNFGIGLGQTKNAVVNGQVLETPSFASGILTTGLTVCPSGNTCFQTLMLNLVPHELNVEDKPCWELDESHELRDVPLKSKKDKTKKQPGEVIKRVIPPRGICDLLTLQTRMIALIPVEIEGKIIVPKTYFTQGRSWGGGEADATASLHPWKFYVKNEGKKAQQNFSILRLNEDKAIWRNSAALFSQENKEHDERSSMAFLSRMRVGRVVPQDFRGGLSVFGVATDIESRKAAKVLMWRHDRLPLPMALLRDPNTEVRVDAAIKDANALESEMLRRFTTICQCLLSPEQLKKSEDHKPDPKNVKNLVEKFNPRRAFWPELENHFLDYLKRLATDHEAARREWRAAIEKTANACFQSACNALGTGPDAVVAVAQVSRYFKLEQILERAQNPKPSRPKTATKR